jgi:hypothetical protein
LSANYAPTWNSPTVEVTAQTALAQHGIRKYASIFVHGAYNLYILITLGGLALAAFALPKAESDIWIARIVVAGSATLLVLLLLFLLYFALTYSRKARYAETLGHSHDVHHALRDLLSEVRAHEAAPSDTSRHLVRQEVEAGFQGILTQLVLALGICTGVRCRASIKLIGVVDGKAESLENLYVRTFVRDAASAHECREKDALEKTNLSEHLVVSNTDYALLVNSSARFFFSDNVANESNYRNTSDSYWNGARPLAALLSKASSWFASVELGALRPYLSVMTFPIRVTRPEAVGESRAIIGFLCIDAASRSAFSRRYDPSLGAAVSDSLYHPLREYGSLMMKSRT